MDIPNARWMAAVIVMGSGVSLTADRVRLRSGKAVEGIFIGGDNKTVRVLLDDGSVSEIPLEETYAVEFSVKRPAPPAPAPRPRSGAKGANGSRRHQTECPTDSAIPGSVPGHSDAQAMMDDPVAIARSIAISRGGHGADQRLK